MNSHDLEQVLIQERHTLTGSLKWVTIDELDLSRSSMNIVLVKFPLGLTISGYLKYTESDRLCLVIGKHTTYDLEGLRFSKNV